MGMEESELQPTPKKTIEEIVKSKNMIGEHSHRARVEIEGLSGIDWPYEIEWYTDRVVRQGTPNAVEWGGGNFVTRADGKILVTYTQVREGNIYLSVVENETEIFTTDDSAKQNEWVFTTINPITLNTPYANQKSSLQKLANGEILLYILEAGDSDTVPIKLDVYKSKNGLGTDFELLTNIFNNGVFTQALSRVQSQIGTAMQLECGRIILPYAINDENGMWKHIEGQIAYSDDNGVTWKIVRVGHNGMYTRGESCRGIMNFNGVLVTSFVNGGNTPSFRFVYSLDKGETWTAIPSSEDEHVRQTKNVVFWDGLDSNYWYNGSQDMLYALPDDIDFPLDEMVYSLNFWQESGVMVPANVEYRTLFATDFGNLAWMGRSNGDSVRLLGGTKAGTPPKPVQLPTQSISISRSKGMIGSSQVVIENKNGMYAPDGFMFNRAIIPNKKIKIYQGYGDNLHQTFTGLIDSVDMTSFPQMLSIKSRDMLKLAKDQMITFQGHNTIVFDGSTLGQIFTRLASLAGLNLGQVDTPDMIITKKEFTWESYLDAMSWLEELLGYQVYCDKEGLVHFVKDDEPSTIDIAYNFKEGEDIVSLSYNIDDSDLYRKVIVFGEESLTEEDEKKGKEAKTIRVDVDYPAADYWNLPQDKILKIDARDADTVEKLTKIAEDAIYLMNVRARQVRFDAIAVPSLEIGDFITVEETSSTISEVYRITGMGSKQDPDSFTMSLDCYHHGQQKQ